MTKPEGLVLTELKVIANPNGNVLHGLKVTDSTFISFGEAYFSTIKKGVVKGWKKHTRMTLNIIVPAGEIRFVTYDDRPGSTTFGKFFEVTLSRSNYQRLTVPPGIWMAFSGMSDEENILLNIASIPHDPTEAENLPPDNEYIKFSWK